MSIVNVTRVFGKAKPVFHL